MKLLLLCSLAAVTVAVSASQLSATAPVPKLEDLDQLTLHVREIVGEEQEQMIAADAAVYGPLSRARKAAAVPAGKGMHPSKHDAIDYGKIVNIGKEVWDAITKGKPSYNETVDHADAVPKGIEDWTELEHWHTGEARDFEFAWKNAAHITAFAMNYRVQWNWGGDCEGHGQFVSHAMVVPSNVKVAWSYDVTDHISVVDILNIGSHDQPIASVQVRMKISIKNTLGVHEFTKDYIVQGDGGFRAL